jgi:hypothetical protein
MGQKHLIHKSNRKVGTSQIFTAASMKITAFCHIAPCNLVEVDQWYSTFFVRVPPDIISLQLCTPKVVGT